MHAMGRAFIDRGLLQFVGIAAASVVPYSAAAAGAEAADHRSAHYPGWITLVKGSALRVERCPSD